MAAPLLAAALVEWRAWDLAGWQRGLELFAVAALLVQFLLRLGILPTVVNLLFLLCGLRLCLPRALPQRRQLMLMAFLLFLTNAVTNSELDFLLWSVAWLLGATVLLLQLNWEPAARLRQGPAPAPPFARVPLWSAAVLVLASGFFVILPRLHLGLRQLPIGVQSLGGLQAGLSDVLDLHLPGAVRANGEVALRIVPAAPLDPDQLWTYGRALGLLRGLVLEGLDGQRWEIAAATPRRGRTRWDAGASGRQPLAADFFVGPGLLGIIPLPYGQADLETPAGEALRLGQGASLRWIFPTRRTSALRVALTPDDVQPEAPPRGERLALLTATGTGTGSALDWSLRAAPGDLPARELAERLAGVLRTSFSYTLANPSGAAANPLQDFLEHSRAGHCEYFASALALMLRHRGVPARVALGYRLGPWIEQGGYFLVTQDQAHSWVEYYDPASAGWRVADPTPAGPPAGLDPGAVMAALARWTDTLRFRWERNVVRFSDEDQLAGAGWAWTRLQALGGWRPGPWAKGLAVLAALGLLGWFGRHGLPGRPAGAQAGPGRIRELRPLLRRVRATLPPGEAETARAWLGRLASLRPDRAGPLARLASESDAVAYGGKRGASLRALARAEARAWKG
jgi:transglutaminase-like putative cysteine protease